MLGGLALFIGPAVAATPTPAERAPSQTTPQTARSLIQLGLYQRESDARWAWTRFQRADGVSGASDALTPIIAPLDANKPNSGVTLRATAPAGIDVRALCRHMVGAGFGCLVLEAAPISTTPAPTAAPTAASTVAPVVAPVVAPATQPASQPTALPAMPPAVSPPPASRPAIAQPTIALPTIAPPAITQPAITQPAVDQSPSDPSTTARPASLPDEPPLPQVKPTAPAETATAETATVDGTIAYAKADAEAMAQVTTSLPHRGRLGIVVPDTKFDVTSAMLRRENWNLCALTFDDGPHPVVTRKILDVLNREKIHATYFPVGKVAAHYGDLIRDFIASGDEIGNHSLSHPDMRALNPDEQRHEIAEANRILRSFGANPVLFRPPYGRYTPGMLAIAREEHMSPVLWTVDTRDWQVRDPDRIVQHVKTEAGSGSVLLLHSTYPSTLTALPRVIAEMRAKGCEFVTLSEWIARMRMLATPTMVNSGEPVVSASAPATTAPN